MSMPYEPNHVFCCRACGQIFEIEEIRVFSVDECPECGPGPLCLECCTCHEGAPLEFAL